jgi:sulfate-transporting ATPase
VQFTQFEIFGSINAVLFAVVGGVGWASGTLLGAVQAPGAAANRLVQELFPSLENLTSWLLIFSGAVVILTLRLAPDGVAALQSASWRRLTARLPVRSRVPAAGRREPARTRPPAELTVRDVTVRFGGVVALDSVGFSVGPGQIVGMIGPNGAGKTTMLDIVTGFTKQSSGSVLLDGEPIDGWSAEQRARRGLARSWQAVELFEEMTVHENLLVAADHKQTRRYLTDLVRPGRVSGSEALDEIVRELRLEPYLDSRPSMLSHGTARLVGIARTLATEPTVLLLDEPAAGLGAREREELGGTIQALCRGRGIGILIIEHDLNLLLSICDRIVALDFGRRIAEGTPEEIRADPAVIAAYLGQDLDAQEGRPAAPAGASDE